MVFKSQHISKTIFKENFSKRYSILYSGSRDSHDIYKWVATQRSLGTPGIVHCVMYKCIMVKLGENKKHIKYVKTRKCYETAKIEGNSKFVVGETTTKKRSSQILSDENRKNFREK